MTSTATLRPLCGDCSQPLTAVSSCPLLPAPAPVGLSWAHAPPCTGFAWRPWQVPEQLLAAAKKNARGIVNVPAGLDRFTFWLPADPIPDDPVSVATDPRLSSLSLPCAGPPLHKLVPVSEEHPFTNSAFYGLTSCSPCRSCRVGYASWRPVRSCSAGPQPYSRCPECERATTACIKNATRVCIPLIEVICACLFYR